ncbi:MAG: hypothetical protein H0Z24_06665 [Thermosipho sp. (in: Bacteria)]|nr:hypothetical protein [Thermosipho sp. (in: thermotogales)]
MRDIKFRAWHKEKRKMFYPIQLEWSKEGYVGKPKGLYIWREPFDDENVDWVSHGEYIEDCELMQYTGLKDINGKEIYEGDIVKINNKHIAQVKFSRGMFKFKLNETIYADFEETDILFPFEVSENDIEVIGNIYKNPELLEQD